jgi:hypothetical protein
MKWLNFAIRYFDYTNKIGRHSNAPGRSTAIATTEATPLKCKRASAYFVTNLSPGHQRAGNVFFTQSAVQQADVQFLADYGYKISIAAIFCQGFV